MYVKGVGSVYVIRQAQILLDLHQVQDMDPQGWITTARRILRRGEATHLCPLDSRYLAGVAEEVQVPRLSDDQAKQPLGGKHGWQALYGTRLTQKRWQ